MSDTPRTDEGYRAHYAEHDHNIELCRQLERELAAEKKLSAAISRDCNNTALERNELLGQLAAANARADSARLDALEEAAKVCDERSLVNAANLPYEHYYKSGTLAQAAVAGRRDEARQLSQLIRALINAAPAAAPNTAAVASSLRGATTTAHLTPDSVQHSHVEQDDPADAEGKPGLSAREANCTVMPPSAVSIPDLPLRPKMEWITWGMYCKEECYDSLRAVAEQLRAGWFAEAGDCQKLRAALEKARGDEHREAGDAMDMVTDVLNDPLSQYVPPHAYLTMVRRAERAEAKLAALKRGEFICSKCGLRKDGEYEPADF